MSNFARTVSDFFLKERGIDIATVGYMEMPNKREKYNLSKTIGNVNLTEGRYKIKSEADIIIANFLSMPLP